MRLLSTQSAVLFLALGLSAASCRPRSRSVETTTATDDSGIEEPSAPVFAPPGTYTCSLEVGERVLNIAACELSETQGLTLKGPEVSLVASLRPEDYGFALEGKLALDAAQQSFKAELYRQGSGSFAALVRIGETSLIRLSVLSKADASAATQR